MIPFNHPPTCASMVAQVLQDLVLNNEIPLKMRGRKTLFPTRFFNCFESDQRLKLSIEEYIDRLAKYLHISDSCFAIALIYIDRLIQSNPDITLNEYSVHKLFTTSLLLAMKFNDDTIVEDREYIQKVVGISFKERRRLEFYFMNLIDFNLFVLSSLFKEYVEFLMLSQILFEDTLNGKIRRKNLKKRLTDKGACSCRNPAHSVRGFPSYNKTNRTKKTKIKTQQSLNTPNTKKMIKKGKLVMECL